MMGAYALLALVALACSAQGATLPQIVGGRDAPEGAHPHQVSLRWSGSHSCGGSIVGKRCILTAAHCVQGRENQLKSLKIHAGTNYQDKQGNVYTASSAKIHENYDSSRFLHDLAVIRTNEDIQTTEKVKAIKLASKNVDHGPCILSGWGTTRLGGPIPNNLQEIDLNIYDVQACSTQHSQVRPSHICTLTKSGEGACHGDSGGPLVANGEQIGIVSFGRPCAVGYPDVYTRVYYYRDWILENC